MPAAVQVKVVAARDLPIMDRSSELTDAFVEVLWCFSHYCTCQAIFCVTQIGTTPCHHSSSSSFVR